MSNNNTGGPAFPRTQWPNETGMTLRDYFAAKAMQVMYQDYARELAIDGERFQVGEPGEPGVSAEGLANESYAMADAMIKARNAAL
jgi:hypothetical protein